MQATAPASRLAVNQRASPVAFSLASPINTPLVFARALLLCVLCGDRACRHDWTMMCWTLYRQHQLSSKKRSSWSRTLARPPLAKSARTGATKTGIAARLVVVVVVVVAAAAVAAVAAVPVAAVVRATSLHWTWGWRATPRRKSKQRPSRARAVLSALPASQMAVATVVWTARARSTRLACSATWWRPQVWQRERRAAGGRAGGRPAGERVGGRRHVVVVAVAAPLKHPSLVVGSVTRSCFSRRRRRRRRHRLHRRGRRRRCDHRRRRRCCCCRRFCGVSGAVAIGGDKLVVDRAISGLMQRVLDLLEKPAAGDAAKSTDAAKDCVLAYRQVG
jgi:hypothetical protein